MGAYNATPAEKSSNGWLRRGRHEAVPPMPEEDTISYSRTILSVISAQASIQAPGLWMPDQVRHDERVRAWLKLIVKRSR